MLWCVPLMCHLLNLDMKPCSLPTSLNLAKTFCGGKQKQYDCWKGAGLPACFKSVFSHTRQLCEISIWGTQRCYSISNLGAFGDEGGKCCLSPTSVGAWWNAVAGTILPYVLHQYKGENTAQFGEWLGSLSFWVRPSPLWQECWSTGWRRLLGVVLCLLCPLSVGADINHSRNNLSHLPLECTCMAKTHFSPQPPQSNIKAWKKMNGCNEPLNNLLGPSRIQVLVCAPLSTSFLNV